MIKKILSVNKILNYPFITNLLNRFVNKYTAHGAIIILIQLEALGIVPNGISQNVDGISNKEILIWSGIAIGIYLVFHLPKPKSKLEKLQYLVEVRKAELELEQTEVKLKKHREKNI